ncbi:hypothetical protein, partial [Brevundimonas sp.]|uniref:hypothetical protein n=1 Tax=Brevundimonas sp. TaxID=1871086 RepID=UPI0027F92B49
ELKGLRTERRDAVQELLALRKGLSARRNRLRGLLALVCAADHGAEALTMIDRLHRLGRTKAADQYLIAQDEADALISRLEATVTAQAAVFSRVTEESPAPDKTGAQLDPTEDPDKFRNNLTDVYATRDVGSSEPDVLPEDDEGETVWCSADYEPQSAEVIEISASRAMRGRSVPVQRVTCPHPRAIIAALPALLRRQDLTFVRHAAFPDDARLAAAYGQASAFRLGLTQPRIIALSLRFGPLPFAVAALLAESTPGVDKRRAYLEGLIQRLGDDKIRVDLWASWQRLVRELGA